jgi:hypothetical protein
MAVTIRKAEAPDRIEFEGIVVEFKAPGREATLQDDNLANRLMAAHRGLQVVRRTDSEGREIPATARHSAPQVSNPTQGVATVTRPRETQSSAPKPGSATSTPPAPAPTSPPPATPSPSPAGSEPTPASDETAAGQPRSRTRGR